VTEQEWMLYADPDPWRRVTHPMLVFLESIGRASERKLRLFAVACCRLLFRKVRVHPWDEHQVNVAERYADSAASADELRGAHGYPPDNWLLQLISIPGGNPLIAPSEWSQSPRTAMQACWNAAELEFGIGVADSTAGNAAWGATVQGTVMPNDNGVSEARLVAELAIQCDLLRCIFGNPFRVVVLAPAVLSWNDGTIVRLAQAAYEERHLPEGTLDNGRLAVLADALEEAGCTDADILDHLRGPGPHVRGCWAVDLCLGKS
jgi:hypothetical protein